MEHHVGDLARELAYLRAKKKRIDARVKEVTASLLDAGVETDTNYTDEEGRQWRTTVRRPVRLDVDAEVFQAVAPQFMAKVSVPKIDKSKVDDLVEAGRIPLDVARKFYIEKPIASSVSVKEVGAA